MTTPPLSAGVVALALLGEGGTTNHDEILAVALLLAFWLLVRVRRQEAARRPPPRRAPTSEVELGQVIFQTARSHDVLAWRGLFLAGRETAEVFGADAERYLEGRSMAVLSASLESLSALIPEGARYDGIEAVGDGAYAIWVAPLAGERTLVGIGTAVRVGGLWRLRDPPFVGSGALPIPAQPARSDAVSDRASPV